MELDGYIPTLELITVPEPLCGCGAHHRRL